MDSNRADRTFPRAPAGHAICGVGTVSWYMASWPKPRHGYFGATHAQVTTLPGGGATGD